VIAKALSQVASFEGLKVLAASDQSKWFVTDDFDIAVFSYTDQAQFGHLWGLTENGGLESVVESLVRVRGNRELTVLVVCDGIPEGLTNPDVARYVTPYDWALALSLIIYRNPVCQKSLTPKIRVLLFHNKSELFGAGFSQQNFFAFHNVVPWIQDYWPVEVGDLSLADVWSDGDSTSPESTAWRRQSVPQGRQDATVLIADLKEQKRVLTTFPDEDMERQHLLKNISANWTEHLLHARSKHTIANLAAPLTLANALPSSIISPSRRSEIINSITGAPLLGRAVNEVLNALDLLRSRHDIAKMPAGGILSGERGTFERKWPVKFLLVDDQFNHGFQHIIAYLLFGNRYAQSGKNNSGGCWHAEIKDAGVLSCSASPDLLLKGLGAAPILDWSLPRRFRLDNVDCDVLLLDLRLWSDSSNAAAVLEEIMKVCRAIGADEIGSPELNSAIKAVESPADREGKALCLLPLLISHYDPSLPIILFSSTHQRAVLELVRHRRNIITNFTKPTVGRDGDESDPARTLDDLRMAIEGAIATHEARIVWERLCSLKVNEDQLARICPGVSATDLRAKTADQQLLRIITAWFQDYVLDARYADLISSIGELNEWLFGDKDIERVEHGWFAWALRWSRNNKLHNFDPTITLKPTSVSELRETAVLCFLFFLDFLQAENKNENNSRGGWTRMSAFLKRKYPKLARTPEVIHTRSGNLLIGEDLNKFEIELPEYVCLALANAAENAGAYLDRRTETSLKRLIDRVIG
jgi:hypothetical protein